MYRTQPAAVMQDAYRAEYQSYYESLLGSWYLVLSTFPYQIVAFPPNNLMLTINSCVAFGSK